MAITENQAPRYTVTTAAGEFMHSKPMGLEFITVEDHVKMIGQCEVTFRVGDDAARWKALEVGSDVEVKVGGDGRKLFVGAITGLRHAYQKGKNTLTVVAMDPLTKLASTRVTQIYEDMKHSDIASQVISRAGATPGTIDATSKVYPYVLQRNESDLRFLRRLAALNGYIVMANEGKIDFKKPQYAGGGTSIAKDHVISMDYSMTPREVPKQITAIGWDYVKKEPVVGTASQGDVQNIGGGASAVDGKLFGGDASISDIWVDSQDEAKQIAASQLNHDARNFLRGRATVQGNGALHAGGMIKFEGQPDGFNAEGFVISSRHKIYVRGGFTTELVFCSNTYPT